MKTQKASSIMAGVAEISIGKRTLTFKFIDDKRNEEKKIVGEKFSVSFDDLPEHLENVEFKAGALVFVATNDKNELLQLRPARGNHVMAFREFAKARDGDGYWTHQVDESWDGKPSGKAIKFSAELVILEGRWAGCVVPHYLFAGRYDKMLLSEIGGSIGIRGNTEKGAAKELLEFFTIAGGEVDVKYPEDGDLTAILAALEKYLKKAKKRFGGILENGYIKRGGLYDLDADQEDDEDVGSAEQEDNEGEEDKSHKKPAHKTVSLSSAEDEFPF